jgi:23S rRNA (cytidine1920-2'-O)/16S rRNA (cytidine1409-2'-O)-methyltransferase
MAGEPPAPPGAEDAADPSAPDRRPARRERLDERVRRAGLAESRSAAQALILSGRVLVDDVPVDKVGTRIREEAVIRLKGGARRFVSRGGEKLAAALDELGLDPRGRACLDVGASTGGFTDCLLQRGAEHVTALDVGHSQLHSRLRLDPRVESRERVNARHLTPDDFDRDFGLFVVDVSFISLSRVLPAIVACAPTADGLLLVKPQFEVGRDRVGKGGVVRDDALRIAAADAVARAAAELGWRERGRVESRVPGPRGNREIFLWIAPGPADGDREGPTSRDLGRAGSGQPGRA